MSRLSTILFTSSVLLMPSIALAQSTSTPNTEVDNIQSDEAHALEQCSQWAQEDGLSGNEKAVFIEECVVDLLSEQTEPTPEINPKS